MATMGDASARARQNRGARPILGNALVLRLVSVAVVCAAWEYAGRVPISPAFPTFVETMAALFGMIRDGSLGRAFVTTLEPLVIGLAASVIAGVGLGVLNNRIAVRRRRRQRKRRG